MTHSAHSRNAYSVHALTATGATLAMLALFSAAQEQWKAMFLWLLASMIVDGIDGPLARRFDVKTHAGRIDGVILDLVIDFLTWVFIPIFALFQSGLLAGWTGWLVALIVTPASALYFADTRMKTSDGSFEGFPGAWSMVVLVFLAPEPAPWVMVAPIVLLTPAMFLPLRFVHPVRTARWRKITLPVAIIWTGAAAIIMAGTHTTGLTIALTLSSVYLLGAGIAQQIFERRD